MSIFFKSEPLFPSLEEVSKSYTLAVDSFTAAQVSIALMDRYALLDSQVRAAVADQDLIATMAHLDDMKHTLEAIQILGIKEDAEKYTSHFEAFKHHAVSNLASQPSTITDPITIIHSMEEALGNDD
mgnify:CR=1 FL=1